MTNFGPTGQTIYDRTYSRTKQDGTKETWPETVERVVSGNIALNPKHLLPYEHEQLCEMMAEFKIIPAGRHLWASGVKGRQYLFNCHVAGWTHHPTDHFRFTFLRLMEGGGVGANYSNHYLSGFPSYSNNFTLHIVCDREHPDYQTMKDAGLLSEKFVSDWDGAYEVEDSREGWADTLDDLISTYYRNDVRFSDRVYDVSRVRESGARLKTFGGSASGPLPLARMLHKVVGIMNSDEYMTRGDGYVIYQHTYLTGLDAMAIDHAIAECVVSGGNRRSARMSIMHWNDPEIIAFLQIKELTGEHWTTNISVEVDDEFWKESKIPNSHAEDVLRAIVNGMGKNGEPGIWNSTKSNIGEPNPVIATNPCGEIPLEEWENCNLGHVNLAAFVNENGHLDTKGLANAHSLMTRFLMRATYGDVNDDKQRSVLARNRRIGVGHFGVASALAMMGIKYSEAAENWNFIKVIQRMADIVDMEAGEYAHNLRIPVPVKTRTVAPTGTIAKMPGVSEGIHPIYAKYFIRRIRFSDVDESQRRQVEQYAFAGYKTEPCQYAPETTVVEIPTKDILLEDVAKIHGSNIAEELVESADELTLEQMLGFQAVYQMTWADNAISYTANIDPKRYANEWEVMDIFHRYGPLLKGMTVFPEFGMAQSPYERISKNDYEYFTTGDGIDENCVNGCPIK